MERTNRGGFLPNTLLEHIAAAISRDSINHVFDLLELLVVRATLLGLLILGACALFGHHP